MTVEQVFQNPETLTNIINDVAEQYNQYLYKDVEVSVIDENEQALVKLLLLRINFELRNYEIAYRDSDDFLKAYKSVIFNNFMTILNRMRFEKNVMEKFKKDTNWNSENLNEMIDDFGYQGYSIDATFQKNIRTHKQSTVNTIYAIQQFIDVFKVELDIIKQEIKRLLFTYYA